MKKENVSTQEIRTGKGKRLIIDGLNCAALSRDQMERTRAGGIAAMNYTVIMPWGDFEASMVELNRNLKQIESLGDIVMIAHSTADISKAQAEGRIAIILGTQNCAFIEKHLSLLGILHRLGIRILQPTYNEQNAFGSGATVNKDEGLTDLGLLLIHEMNRLGFVIDLSHCGYRTSYEAIGASSKPVIFSHANALSLCKSPRNKPDILIRAIAEKGGVAGAVCWAPLLKQATRPSLEDYLDQLDYMINLAGIEHVSFASDLSEDYYLSEGEWDMAFGPHGMYPVLTGGLGDWYTFEQQFPEGCESLEKAAHIWEGLVLRGYSEDDAEKIMCKNLQRVFREVWGN